MAYEPKPLDNTTWDTNAPEPRYQPEPVTIDLAAADIRGFNAAIKSYLTSLSGFGANKMLVSDSLGGDLEWIDQPTP